MSDGRLIRITTDEGEQYVPLTKPPEEVRKYDVVVSEAPTSPNQKEETFALLSAVMPQLVQMGVPIPPEVLEFLPLPADLIAKWKQMLTQPNPAQEQLQQANLALTQARAEKEQSVAMLNQVKAMVEQAEARLRDIDARLRPIELVGKLTEERSSL